MFFTNNIQSVKGKYLGEEYKQLQMFKKNLEYPALASKSSHPTVVLYNVHELCAVLFKEHFLCIYLGRGDLWRVYWRGPLWRGGIPGTGYNVHTVLYCTTQQSWARDNTATTCFLNKQLFIIALHLYSLWLLHYDTEALTFFKKFLVTEALLRCCVIIVAKLNNCRVPSSAISK